VDLNETIQRRTRGFQQQLEILEDPPRLAGEGAGGLWDELERDPTCRCVILTGAGQRTFTVGADISDDLSAGPEVARVVNHALLENDAYSKPIVAAVNGDCIGGGLELLLSTDIRAAVPEARFGLPEVGDLSVRRPGTAPIRSRIAAHCAYGDCLRPKLRWRGWRRGVLPRALWPSASSAPR
jgi:hypothetical protein